MLCLDCFRLITSIYQQHTTMELQKIDEHRAGAGSRLPLNLFWPMSCAWTCKGGEGPKALCETRAKKVLLASSFQRVVFVRIQRILFRFFNYRMFNPDYDPIIPSAWQIRVCGCSTVNLITKLEAAKGLLCWKSRCYGNMSRKVVHLKEELEEVLRECR